tara:strand:- start:49 stop:174 length:126 start_codon:yes stop_codon:yes gene_type:complete
MGSFNGWEFVIWFFCFLLLALKDGGKTSHQDEDIDDYWSDG